MMFFVVVYSAILGSFANMLIYRLPRSVSIRSGRSCCPSCAHPLTPLDLIPIVSYLLLRGKCRHCRRPISWRYVIVELLCVAIGVGLASFWGFGVSFVYAGVYAGFVSFLCVLVFFIDLETQLIPQLLIVLLGCAGILWHLLSGQLMVSLLGIGISGAAFWGLAFITERLYDRPTFGDGDIKLLAAFGSILGWQGALWSLYYAFILGGAFAAGILILKKKKWGDKVPFGPFLVLGFSLAYLTH
jgi:leader peptidase (prepilin peptidase)/N-methyltransferase